MDFIREICGNHIGLIKNLKMGGVGSPRLYYKKGNSEIDTFFALNANIKVCNLQIREKGFMFRFNDNTVVLAMPFSFQQLQRIYIQPHKNETLITFFIESNQKVHTLEFTSKNQVFKKLMHFFMKPIFQNKIDLETS